MVQEQISLILLMYFNLFIPDWSQIWEMWRGIFSFESMNESFFYFTNSSSPLISVSLDHKCKRYTYSQPITNSLTDSFKNPQLSCDCF